MAATAVMSGGEAPFPRVAAVTAASAGAAVHRQHLNHEQNGKKVHDLCLNKDGNFSRQKVGGATLQTLDPAFVWPEDTRPDIPHDHWDLELPVVDLSPVLNLRRLRKEIAGLNAEARRIAEAEIEQCEARKRRVEREIRAACEEYGFFQIVNHGFPMDVVHQLQASAKEILDLPLEEKMKIVSAPPTEEILISSGGFNPCGRPKVYQKVGKQSWNEAFGMECPEVLYPGRLEQNVNCLWPEEPDRSSKGLNLRFLREEYSKHANKVSILVLNLMATSLGLPEPGPEGTLLQGLRGDGTPDAHIMARCNVTHYPICSQPELTFGVINHTDPSIITLLHQDHVGGLQIRFKDGSWHGVRPLPGAFVVNVGNFLQVLTNGRFISAEHRVAASCKSERYSIVYFVADSMDAVFSPRPELVDAEHPQMFRPFQRKEYLIALAKYGRVSEIRTPNFTDMYRQPTPN